MLSVVEPHFLGRKPIPPSLALPPGRAGRPVVCRYRSFMACLSVRPRTSSLLFLGLPGQTIVLSLVGSSSELWWARGKTARHPSSLCAFGRVLGMGFNEGTPTSWGRLPLASSYSPGGSGVVVHSPGRRSGPTLPHREAKVSEWGRLPMIGASSSLGTPRDASGC